ncbi:MAG: hypothetical protein ACRDD1_20110, partial [Planctomycetia bacterium]
HELSAILEDAPTADGAPPADVLKRMDEKAAAVVEAFRELELRYVAASRFEADVDLPSLWMETIASLAVPYPDARLRLELLGRLQRISAKFLAESEGFAGAAASTSPAGDFIDEVTAGPPPATDDGKIRRWGRRWGEGMAAVLGQQYFAESQTSADLETYDQLQHRLETFEVEEQWWDSLTAVADQLARRTWLREQVVTDRLDAAATAPGGEVVGPLAAANRLIRATPYLPAARVLKPQPIVTARDRYGWLSAANEYRRSLLTNFFLGQAARTRADHWFEADPAAVPFYVAAGARFTDDARLVAAAPSQRQAVETAAAWWKQSGRIEVRGPAETLFTTEQSLTLRYELAPADGAWTPPGLPKIWATADAVLTLAKPTPSAPAPDAP